MCLLNIYGGVMCKVAVFFVRFEVSTSMTMKIVIFWDVTLCTLVRTYVSEELSASFIRVTRIGE
jgi:hypothetical protein